MSIYGYKTKIRDYAELMEKIGTAESVIRQIAGKKYHKLLGHEVALWADLYALNAVEIPKDVPIFDYAVRMLSAKMLNASQAGVFCEYNFSVYAHIVPYGQETYINVLCAQSEFLKPFDSLFMPVKVMDGLSAEMDQEKMKMNEEVWKEIQKTYKGRNIPGIDLTPKPEPDIKKVKYPSKKERCAMQARHRMLNGFLSNINAGQQILPVLLMPLIDDAYEALCMKENKTECAMDESKLMGILLDLEKQEKMLLGTKE